MRQYPAIILAGGSFRGERQQKCFICVNGRPLVAAAAEALQGCAQINYIVLVAQDLQVPRDIRSMVDLIAPPGESVITSVRSGARCFAGTTPFLVVCGDQPALRPDMISHFIEHCEARPDADAWWGFVAKRHAERACPGFPHTYARLLEGTFCGAGVAMLRTSVLASPAATELEQARKSVFKLILRLGPWPIVRYVTGTLTIRAAEAALRRLVGRPVVGIETPYGELSLDLDSRHKLVLFQERYRAG